MRGGVIIKVGEEQVRVAAVEQAADEVGITLAVGIAAAHALEHAAQPRAAADVRLRVVARSAQGLGLVGMQAEEEHIVSAELLEHLDVRTVERADRDGAVHHELHVAGAAGLLAGGRDLLGHLRGGHEHLGGGDTVVRQEIHLQLPAADGVGIHIGRERAQQLDDALGRRVAGRGLGRKQERARLEGLIRVVVQHEL